MTTLRQIVTLWRHRTRPSRSDAAMTLVETLIAIVILGVLVAGTTVIFIATTRDQRASGDRTENTAAKQRVQSWVLFDVQSTPASGIDVSPDTPNPCPGGTAGSNVFLATWSDPSEAMTYFATYRRLGTTLTRDYCRRPSAATTGTVNLDNLVLASNVTAAVATPSSSKLTLTGSFASGGQTEKFSITGLLRDPVTRVTVAPVTTATPPPDVGPPPCAFDDSRGKDDPAWPQIMKDLGWEKAGSRPKADDLRVNARGDVVLKDALSTPVAVAFAYDYHGSCPDYDSTTDPNSADFDPSAAKDNVEIWYYSKSDSAVPRGSAAVGSEVPDLPNDQPSIRIATFPPCTSPCLAGYWLPVDGKLKFFNWGVDENPPYQMSSIDVTKKGDSKTSVDFKLKDRAVTCQVKDNAADLVGLIGPSTTVPRTGIFVDASGKLRNGSAPTAALLTGLRVTIDLDGPNCSPYDASSPASNLTATICLSDTVAMSEPFGQPAGSKRSATFDLVSRYASIIWAKIQYNVEARDSGSNLAFMTQKKANEVNWTYPPGCPDPSSTQVDKDMGKSIGLQDGASFTPR